MYAEYFTGDTTVLISVFGLAWFLIGVAIGARLPSKARIEQRAGGMGERGSRGGNVELYVGNLSYDITRKDLAKTFGKYGEVGSVRIIKNRFDGKSKGFGFVQMPNASEATAAIEALHGTELKGRKIVVNEAKSPARKR